MAKNAWGDEVAVAEDPKDWGDKPAAQRELPAGVTPSLAGGGRGSVNPRPVRTPDDSIDLVGDPQGFGSAAFEMVPDSASVDAKRTRSAGRVLDKDIPNPTPISLARDAAAGALQVGPTVVKGVGDIVRLATGDTVGKGVTDFAETGNRAIQEVVGSERGGLQRKQFQQDMQDPALNAADVVGGNPGAIADQVLPAVGSMAIPVGAAAAASKLATTGRAAQLAAAIDPATVAARAAAASNAAVVGSTVAQNAGSTFSTVRDEGGDLGQAYLAAAITAPATYLASRLTGGGAEGNVARAITGQPARRVAGSVPGAVLKEAGQEMGEEAGAFVGETTAQGQAFDPNVAGKRLAVAGTLGAIVGGGADVAVRIQRLKDAGETEAAAMLERRHTAAAVDTELGQMGEAVAHPKFQATYRQQREQGRKPAEAAGRAGMLTGFEELVSGLSDKALAAARERIAKMPMEEIPGFLERYTASLSARGMGQALPPGSVAQVLGAVLDDAMGAALDTVYGDTPAATMADIEQLEQQLAPVADQNQPDLTGNAASLQEPAFNAGNDVLVTPETDAVHTAATSPLNDLPEPTEAQKKAGNYAVGRLRIAGMDISIENPQGSVRRGTDPDGKAWESPMRTGHYGYIRKTEGADGDHLDVFVKPGTPDDYSGPVFVVDQIDPKTGKFDEAKVVLGATDQADAEAIYRGAYDANWQGLGAISQLPMPAFKAWAKSGTLKEPLGDLSKVQPQAAAAAAPAEVPASSGPAASLSPAPVPAPGPAGAGGDTDASLSERYGRDHTPLSEGGQPFKHRKEADTARKQQQGMRVLKVKGGFVLAQQTPAQLAAGAKAAKRLSNPQTSPIGEPIPAHSFIASEGGMARETMPDMGFDRNVRIGNRSLFVAQGRGLTLEQATLKLVQDGYLPEGASHTDTANLISRSLKTPQYNPEGWERIVEAEQQARFEDHMAAQREEGDLDELTDGLNEQDLEGLEYEQAEFAVQEEFHALIAAAEAEDIGSEEIVERAHELAQNGADHDSPAVTDIQEARASRRPAAAGASPEQGRQAAERAGAEDGPALSGQQGAARSEVAPPTWSRNPSGTLTVNGDPEALRKLLTDGGISRIMVAKSGVLVGKTEVEKAEKLLSKLRGKPAKAAPTAAKPLTVGIMAANAEPVTVKDGIVFIGKYEAVDFNSGEPVKVKDGASDAEIKQALKDAEVLTKRQKFFGGRSDDAAPEQAMFARGEGERYAAGKALTKEQRKQVIGTLVDVYKAKGAPREFKGQGRDGNERYGYAHSPDLFEKSDITGAMVRYHVRLPDGRLAHPSELFPDYTQADIDKAMIAQDVADKQDAASQKDVEQRAAKYAAPTKAEAESSFRKRNPGFEMRDWRTGKDRTFVHFEKDGRFFAITDDDTAHMTRLERAGWARTNDGLTAPTEADILAQQQRAKDGEAADAKAKKDRGQRAQADAEVDEFTLTGSNRAADADPKQSGMFKRDAEKRSLTDLEITSAMRIMAVRPGGLSVDQAQKIIGQLTAKWKNGPKVHVVASHRDLPVKAPSDARGLYYKGEVWIVAGAHRDAKDARASLGRTLAHEAIAHAGLRTLLGKDGWASLMKNVNLAIASGNKPLGEIKAHIRRVYVDDSGKFTLSPNLEADEIAARAVELAIDENGEFKPGFSFLKATYARIAQFLRDLGIDVKFTTAELHGMLVLSQRGLEVGKRVEGGQQVMVAAAREEALMLRVFHGSPHEFTTFSTDNIGTGEGAQAYGWGLYFAGKREVAEHYRKTLSAGRMTIDGKAFSPSNHSLTELIGKHKDDDLSKALQIYIEKNADNPFAGVADARMMLDAVNRGAFDAGPVGRLYEVEIPEEGEYLLWDKPLSEQPTAVREALEKLSTELATADPQNHVSRSVKQGIGGEAIYRYLSEELAAPAGDESGMRGWTNFTPTINDKRANDRAASQKLQALGVRGIKYLDGSSRTRTLREVKREFLSELPEDADFDEVMDLIGDGTFSPANEAILKALAENDWLGFDYPAQAISAALGGDLGQFDASESLVQAVADAQGGATFNYVVFDDAAVKIEAMFARAQPDLFAPDGWTSPDPTRTDAVIYELQDGRVDLKRIQQAIKAAGRAIEEKFDPRLAESLYPGRVARRTDVFLDREVKPLLEAMAREKIAMDELADYLIARHAPERNEQVAKVNPDLPDGGAGKNSQGTLMTDAAAAAYLAALPEAQIAKLAALAEKVDAITRGTRTLLVAEGLEKAATVAAWEGAYSNYVPLFKDETEHPHPQGMGFTVKGPASKRATGSTKQVTNVIAHVLMQREAAISRAEKNRVGLALYGLALSHPNPAFWTTIKPGMSNEQVGQELQAMGVDPTVAAAGMQGIPTLRMVDPLTQTVVDRPNPIYKNLPGAITLKVNGEDRVLMLSQKDERAIRMAEALKNLDGLTNFDLAGNIVGKTTRWLAAVNTQYNPAFGLINLVRDTLGGSVNLGSTALKGKTLVVLGNVPMAMQGIARELSGGGQASEWSRLWKQFQDDGGKTGYREVFAMAEDRARAIEKELAGAAKAGKLTPGKVGHAVLDLLDGFNTTLENAVRLSAYRTALDQGLSRAEAARLGRELTVDFNRKGRMGRELGPLYAFFNASVQGGARTIETLKGPTGAKVIAGGLALGAIQALLLAAMGYEDDEIGEYVKTRALIIPLPPKADGEKRFVAIPYPLGLHVIPNTGRVITEMSLNGGKDLGPRAFGAVGEIASAFNPLGGGNIFTADGALKTVAPTVVDPVIELAANKNFAGNSISKESQRETDNRPGYQRAKEATLRSTTGQVYLGISKAINALTGGDAYQRGIASDLASPTPEQVRYIAQTAGGGVLREFEKTIDSSVRAVKGEKVKMTGIPVAGRFYGEVDEDQVQMSRYYDKGRKIDQIQSSIKAAEKAGDGEALTRLITRHPDALLMDAHDKVQREIAALNKLAVSTVGTDDIKVIDAARVAKMKALNDLIRDMEQAAGQPTLGQKLRGAVKRSDVAEAK